MSVHRLSLAFMACLGVSVGCLSLANGVALAAAEAPQMDSPIEVSAHRAVLLGELNPGKEGEPGTYEMDPYEFVYRATSSGECEGAGELVAGSGISLGAGQEQVFQEVSELNEATTYAACLIVHEGIETTVSTTVSFTTTSPPEAPEVGPASEVAGREATLNGVLNPNHAGEAGSYSFIYIESPTGCQGQGGRQPQSTESQHAAGGQDEAVSARVTGLLPATTYAFCLSARNEAGEEALSGPLTFTTGRAPVAVNEESLVQVGSGEATVAAAIDPGGEAASYQVEYGAGKLTAVQELAASNVPAMVRVRLSGLSAGTEYHYRFIAHNRLGAAEGAQQAFTTASPINSTGGGASRCPNATYTGFDPALPDCRAFELVSSPTDTGDVYDPGGSIGAREQDITTARPFRAAADGQSVAYLGDPGPVGGDGGSAKGKGNEYLARRSATPDGQGWETTNISPPVGEGESTNVEHEYTWFSDDLSVGALFSSLPLLAAHPEPQGPEGCAVLYGAATAPIEFHALFTKTSTPKSCERGSGSAGRDHKLIFAGESGDHRQVFFQTPVALTATVIEAKGVGGNLYDSSNGALTEVNVLPSGVIDPNATFGGPSRLPASGPDLSGAISADGERVFWTAVELGEGLTEQPTARPEGLYAREASTSVQLDTAERGASGASGGGQFETASSDGSRVFFTDCSRLTPDSTADSGGGCYRLAGEYKTDEVRTGNDLYEYDFSRPPGERLVDLTVDHNAGDPLGADVQGVVGASVDGSYVYFIAGGALESEPNERGQSPAVRDCEMGQSAAAAAEEERGSLPVGLGCNLYELHDQNGVWGKPRFIAALAAHDNYLAAESLNDPKSTTGGIVGDWVGDLGSRTAEVSPDGRHLVFESMEDLTGYDTSSIGLQEGGEGGEEVFAYDASSGRLACASCDPAGLAPPLVGESQSGKNTTFASYLPVSSSATFMHRWTNEQGTEVFFDSSQPLAAGDSNGTQDVYEWEAEGGSSCPVATSRYGGCVFLLSGGESSDFSFLVDSDANGENVFIAHRGALLGAGPQDDKNHLYDVRVDGGFEDTTHACTGTGCQGTPASAPLFATPASVTFEGPGNFVAPAAHKKKTAKHARRKGRIRHACRRRRAGRGASCARRAPHRGRGKGSGLNGHSTQGRKA